jgi:hypothetical protein
MHGIRSIFLRKYINILFPLLLMPNKLTEAVTRLDSYSEGTRFESQLKL